jgi:hypothetical protein
MCHGRLQTKCHDSTPEKESQDEEKEQDKDAVDDGNKKPRAKRKQAETE